jgi:serine/threonine protein kinase
VVDGDSRQGESSWSDGDRPQALGDFDLQERIGEGSSAVVYRAVHQTFRGLVAVKLWRAPLTEAQRLKFLDECKLQWRLAEHPNIVRLHWADAPADAPPWLATELYETSLAQRVFVNPVLTLTEKLDYADDILAGLVAIHNEGMLHRDVKPANVLLKGRTAALGDLGITMRAGALTRDSAAGTEAFLAPELLRGDPPSFRSDVFSAAVTIRYMFSHDIPSEIEAVLTRAASHNPDDRPANAKAFRDQLRVARDQVEEHQGRGAWPASEMTGPAPWSSSQAGEASLQASGPPTGAPRKALLGRWTGDGERGTTVDDPGPPRRSGFGRVAAAIVAAVVLVAVGGYAFHARQGGASNKATAAPVTATSASSSVPATTTAAAAQFDIEKCTPEMKKNPQWVCLTQAVLSGTQLVLLYDTNFTPSSSLTGFHMHVFSADYTDSGLIPPDSVEGMQQQPESSEGSWWTDYSPKAFTLDTTRLSDSPMRRPFNTKNPFVCMRVATQSHGLVHDQHGGYATGNCLRITK